MSLGSLEQSLSSLIQPNHPIVRQHAEGLLNGDSLPEDLSKVFACYEWIGVRRMSSYEEVGREGRGNCLALAAMMCATAMAVGWDRSRVLVSGGGLISRSLIVTTDNTAAVTVHAWAILTPPSGRGWIVDPVNMRPETIGTADEFERRLQVAAPVDRIFPIVFGLTDTRVFASPRQAHAYLLRLWKP